MTATTPLSFAELAQADPRLRELEAEVHRLVAGQGWLESNDRGWGRFFRYGPEESCRLNWTVAHLDGNIRDRLAELIDPEDEPAYNAVYYHFRDLLLGKVRPPRICASGRDTRISHTPVNCASSRRSRNKPSRKLAAAKVWLAERLGRGPVPSQQLRAEGRASGHSWGSVKRALVALGVRARRGHIDERGLRIHGEKFTVRYLPEPTKINRDKIRSRASTGKG